MGFQRSAQELKRTFVDAKSQCEHFSFRFRRLSCEKYCVTSIALINPVEKQAPAHPYSHQTLQATHNWAETIGRVSVSNWNTSLVRLTSREALHVKTY